LAERDALAGAATRAVARSAGPITGHRPAPISRVPIEQDDLEFVIKADKGILNAAQACRIEHIAKANHPSACLVVAADLTAFSNVNPRPRAR
jgi:hypothetical protein